MNKKKLFLILFIIFLLLVIGVFYVKKINFNLKLDEDKNLKITEDVTVLPTMQDEISGDSAWCATFQLVWNDLKNELVKKDIEFTPQEVMANNLNKEEFTDDMISDDYYFKIYGLKSLELKEKIENGIKEKFNQDSDILNDFDWSNQNMSERRYFFYTMLYRNFEFLKEFEELENGSFANKYNDIKYFGIGVNSDESIREQIEVLYYNSQDDFAILLNTKTNDEVIFCKSPDGNTFKEIYFNMKDKQQKYSGNTSFEEVDEFKAPYIDFNIKREYTEFQGKAFETADFQSAVIEKAIQTIKFSLNEKGGEIKSEAAIEVKRQSIVIREDENKPRYFYIDDTFALFLREKGRNVPYFAANISDISKFQ